MFVTILLASLSSAFVDDWSPTLGGEMQIGRSGRGIGSFEGLLTDRIREYTSDGTVPYGDHSTYFGVVEWAAFVRLGVERPLGTKWFGTGSISLGYAKATGETAIEGGKLDGEGFRWEIASPMASLGAGLRRSFGEHWSFRTELVAEHGFLGTIAVYALPDEEKLADGDAGESGTVGEDLTLALRARLKIGPEWRLSRVVVFPWIGIGATQVMTSDSKIGGLPCEDGSGLTNGSIGTTVSWRL